MVSIAERFDITDIRRRLAEHLDARARADADVDALKRRIAELRGRLMNLEVDSAIQGNGHGSRELTDLTRGIERLASELGEKMTALQREERIVAGLAARRDAIVEAEQSDLGRMHQHRELEARVEIARTVEPFLRALQAQRAMYAAAEAQLDHAAHYVSLVGGLRLQEELENLLEELAQDPRLKAAGVHIGSMRTGAAGLDPTDRRVGDETRRTISIREN